MRGVQVLGGVEVLRRGKVLGRFCMEHGRRRWAGGCVGACL